MDPRILRTRGALQRALLDLVRDRDLDDITVADIVERAGVTRSSFYLHYTDKDGLLADALDAFAEAEGAELPALLELLGEPPQALEAYLRHFDQHAELYRRVLGDHGSAVAVARLSRRIEQLAFGALESTGTDAFPGVPIDVAAAGLAGDRGRGAPRMGGTGSAASGRGVRRVALAGAHRSRRSVGVDGGRAGLTDLLRQHGAQLLGHGADASAALGLAE